MNFKKTVSILLGAVLITGSISGCGENKEVSVPSNDKTNKALDKITVQSLWLPQG